MSSTMETKTSHGGRLPVHIVEQHNDVVPFIHRMIASKNLPFTGIPIIHLDSHPDLLIPVHLDADTVFKPKELYESLSIENWLLPLVFAKHIDHVIWMKPPWANQIMASTQPFVIGKCCHTGKLRLSCKENYFLTDGLFCKPSDLTETAKCQMTVVSLRPSDWDTNANDRSKITTFSREPITHSHSPHKDSNNINKNSQPESLAAYSELSHVSKIKENESVPSQKDRKSTDALHDEADANIFSEFNQWVDYLLSIVHSKPFILDIDLDFFSTKNPFKEMFQSEKEAMQEIFRCPPLLGSSDEEIETFTCLRKKQLEELENLFTALHEKWTVDKKASESPDNILELSLADMTGLSSLQLDYFQTHEQKNILRLCQHVIPTMKQREVTFLQLFDFGCTLDDTELPHHVSSESQIQSLASSLRSVLGKLPKPTVITISRSCHDDYCPENQVEEIQQMVLKMLTDIYGPLDITKNFED